MSNRYETLLKLRPDAGYAEPNISTGISRSGTDLPAAITRDASKQTYYTIRFLADRDRVLDAFRAYAYFRWVDDCVDEQLTTQSRRLDFIARQQMLINSGNQRNCPRDLTAEETMLMDLLRGAPEKSSGLQRYVQHMMAVMEFDAHRRGRLISEQELTDYTRHLAIGVTEALHYFIGHRNPPPNNGSRYLAVAGAHITHMLRDTYEDVAAGYFNIPQEFLALHGIDPDDTQSEAYREWVKNRVRLARANFESGKRYIGEVDTLRCRIAGHAYVARFEVVLDAIERENYQLRSGYPERKSRRALLRIIGKSLSGTIRTAA